MASVLDNGDVAPVDTTPLTRSQKAKGFAALAALVLSVVGYFVADLAGTPIVRTGAVVAAKYDIIGWTRGYGGSRTPDQCRIKLLTEFGTLTDSFLGLCDRVAGDVDQPICLDVRIGRISGSVLILHGPADKNGANVIGSGAPAHAVSGQIPACAPPGA